MSLGKNELVVAAHDPMVQGQHHVQRREIAANVTNAALEMHLEQTQSRFPQDVLQGIPTTPRSLPYPRYHWRNGRPRTNFAAP